MLLALSVIAVPSVLNFPKKSLPFRVCSKILYINLFLLILRGNWITRPNYHPWSRVYNNFGYLLFTLKWETEFYGKPKNLNSVAFAIKYPKYQSIKIVSFLSSTLGFMFFRGSGKLLIVSVTLSGVRSWIIERENKILTLNIS